MSDLTTECFFFKPINSGLSNMADSGEEKRKFIQADLKVQLYCDCIFIVTFAYFSDKNKYLPFICTAV